MSESVKEEAVSRLFRLKVINLMAEGRGVTLDEDEKALVRAAADIYYDSINEKEKELCDISRSDIEKMYTEYALADKLYNLVIADINPEISDDEARIITVEHILLKTYDLDPNGKKNEFDEEKKNTVRAKANELHELAIEEGADFESLARNNSDDDNITYSFGKGEMDPVFETAAFDLAQGEISDVLETEYGYHIIKCISTFDRDETDANKLKIIEERKNSTFLGEYDAYADSITRSLNNKLFDKIDIADIDSDVTGSRESNDFFEIYEEVFTK
ncbi:MAG: peptidylprolyl isomerase [Lachnospiraceae bacterium]|nr:peptidylprolyl isomerase [Lachnospiraceae bacterium]